MAPLASLVGRSASRSESPTLVQGGLLDSRSVAAFNGGKYLVWTLSGHVQIRFTNLANGLNTVLSGIFFGPGGAG